MPEAFVLETLRTARTKATMLAGWGNVPGVTINRFCASGIDAVAQEETLAALEPAFVRQGAARVAVLVERVAS
jgi:acetyl-CoA acetyltransferase